MTTRNIQFSNMEEVMDFCSVCKNIKADIYYLLDTDDIKLYILSFISSVSNIRNSPFPNSLFKYSSLTKKP